MADRINGGIEDVADMSFEQLEMYGIIMKMESMVKRVANMHRRH